MRESAKWNSPIQGKKKSLIAFSGLKNAERGEKLPAVRSGWKLKWVAGGRVDYNNNNTKAPSVCAHKAKATSPSRSERRWLEMWIEIREWRRAHVPSFALFIPPQPTPTHRRCTKWIEKALERSTLGLFVRKFCVFSSSPRKKSENAWRKNLVTHTHTCS